ncbi:MAG: hypothetical protein A3I78_04430 [Gammaproteobacteria bacterium RIFCSPLOWO2_02_FULL_56_15]|nr:MAG: hypothetical protein A3I78_04430 [Gammaproteobacteria bacterium RIFCSPLOWO2_02_FULL_56_15]
MRILIAFGVACLLQPGWHFMQPAPEAVQQDLPEPLSVMKLRLAGLDDPVALSKILMLWLQAFDNQPGISIPFSRLDYNLLIRWLDRIVELDERSHYPLLAASRLYSLVPDAGKKRLMLEFVRQKFLQDPGRRWQWLAHCIYVAKYQLKDLDLALDYARTLRLQTKSPAVPYWARHMEVYVLEDMGNIEAAKILIGGLLESNQVEDPAEIRFLQERLNTLADEE